MAPPPKKTGAEDGAHQWESALEPSDILYAVVRIGRRDMVEQLPRFRLVLDQPLDYLDEQRLEPFDLGRGDRLLGMGLPRLVVAPQSAGEVFLGAVLSDR